MPPQKNFGFSGLLRSFLVQFWGKIFHQWAIRQLSSSLCESNRARALCDVQNLVPSRPLPARVYAWRLALHFTLQLSQHCSYWCRCPTPRNFQGGWRPRRPRGSYATDKVRTNSLCSDKFISCSVYTLCIAS